MFIKTGMIDRCGGYYVIVALGAYWEPYRSLWGIMIGFINCLPHNKLFTAHTLFLLTFYYTFT